MSGSFFHKLHLWVVAMIVILITGVIAMLSIDEQSASAAGFGQEKNVERSASVKKSDFNDSLFKAAIQVLYTDPGQAREIIMRVLENPNGVDSILRIRSTNLLGATYHLQANYNEALATFYTALELALKSGNTQRMADVYNNLGTSSLKIGNHKEAMDYFLKSIEQYRLLNDTINTASTFNNIGLLYKDIDNPAKARIKFNEALQGFKYLNDTIGIAATLSNIGMLLNEQGQYDSALYYHRISIDLNIKKDNKYGLIIGYQGLANIYNTMGQTDSALANYNKSKSIALIINQPFQMAFSDLGIAHAFIKAGNLKAAILHTDSAMLIANEIDNIKLQQEAHETYAEAYEAMKNTNRALEHFRLAGNLKDSMINQTKLHQIYNLEIEQLSLAKEVQQLEIQRQELLLSKKNNIIIFIVIAFLLALFGFYLLYLNHNHRKESNTQKMILSLTEKKSRAAAEAEIQERKRIGQELHDGLGQMLSAARLNMSALQQKEGLPLERRKELLEAAIEVVDAAFSELRNISHDLAPSVLMAKGFAGALKDMADQINKTSHIHVQLQLYGLNGKMDSIIENTLYRALQELLSNAIKHADASLFSVQIVKGKDEITVMVEDDGKGFDEKNMLILPGGGLSNIRSRIENLKGDFFIDSMKNRGTIISIVIPLSKINYVPETYTSAGGR
ncbi:MAG: tetratricopeptide repeat protein [Clostridia bacterium]|nr:tetratricopeptide repeat protein [Clostridia bacterium]